ncbi:hypothetical protein CEXT_593641 [Caerostris extrusa]|uniref:Uncharacterized protein n=1 Tax=Caerostris extrusa TaxID=172846 RepID=A0AAV4Q2D3_CAEEX|nr:hypothetical protein CEXT_593641 [Caerostris extrusa]
MGPGPSNCPPPGQTADDFIVTRRGGHFSMQILLAIESSSSFQPSLLWNKEPSGKARVQKDSWVRESAGIQAPPPR